MKLILGDSKIKLKDLPENSVDSVVTDCTDYKHLHSTKFGNPL